MTEYTNLEIPPAPQVVDLGSPPAQQKRGCLRYGLIGCGGLLVLGLCFVAALILFVGALMRSSDAYQETMRRVRSDARVAAKLGAPIDPGYFIQGQIHTTAGGKGEADLTIPVSGPKGDASAHVSGTKSGGIWKYSEMRITFADGSSIDLAASAAIEQEY